MILRKATRQKAKLRIGLSAASGFGKTYSALLIAFGITGNWEKIAVIDTEHGSSELYSHLGGFNALSLTAPYSPERYIEAIKACEAAGMEVIIIDSITHEWEGRGGCLEIVEKLGGKFQNWAQVTPRHQSFIDAILQSSCHVITTVRRKQDYVMGKDNNGKNTVEKAGMKEVTRDGFEYELTANLEIINDRHLVKASKDRTGLFADKPEFIPTIETGQMLRDWAESGVSVLDMAVNEMKVCTERSATAVVWNKYPNMQSEQRFIDAAKEMALKFPKEQPAPAPEPEKMMPALATEDDKNVLRKMANEVGYEKQVLKVMLLKIDKVKTVEESEALKDELQGILDDVLSQSPAKTTPKKKEGIGDSSGAGYTAMGGDATDMFMNHADQSTIGWV